MTEPQEPSRYQVTQMQPGYGWAPVPMPSVTPYELKPPRPATLTTASWVWLAATLLGVLSMPLLLWVNSESIATSIFEDSRHQPEPLTLEEARITVTVLVFLALFGALVLSIPFVIGALRLRSGKNWPRVMLSVLGGVTLIYDLALFAGSLAAGQWQYGVVMAVATAGLTIAGIVLMFLPPSNAYVSMSDFR
ncbi:hypothetical protein FKR81_30920 [Lentzea tibetensis]|uniref:Uncharacterized protein n=1 Tax=Lentzea tibetensis TaxID=2591470 RepID=A0A563EL78_9PSEU|nr:hypothetical protein [Lentzea tibetensis]TWP47758.1 hypothetical protein FKR81_30920 [Lentzea tibetensis]